MPARAPSPSDVRRRLRLSVFGAVQGVGFRPSVFRLAEEMGLNVFYGGHYATETFGVKALAADLSKKFRVPWIFLDHPTGL